MHQCHPCLRLAAVLALGLTLLSTSSSARQDVSATKITAITAAEFFSTTKVWTAHLTLTAKAWEAMQPRYGSAGGGSRFLGPAGGRNGVAARQGIEFDYVPATLRLGDWTFRDVALRYKGNGSYLRATRAGGDKISLKVDLNKYVKGQKLAGLTTLNFQNNVTDAGWMNEVLAYRLYRDAGALAPRTTYAQVHLTVEGQGGARFLGLYSVSENVDETFFEERFGTRKGAILKPSTEQLFTDWGPDWAAYNQSYDPKTDLTDAQKARVIALGRLVSSASDEEFARRIGDFVDLDDFVRYFTVLVWLGNHDSLLQNGQNFYTWLHPDTNRMHFIAWDQDFSFGNNRASATNRGIEPARWPIDRPWSVSSRFLERLYAVESFRARYFARLAELSDRLVLPERFAAQVSEITPAIRPSIERESRDWLPGFDQIAAGRSGIVPFTRERAAFVKAQLTSRATGR
jgi:spore coat protein H